MWELREKKVSRMIPRFLAQAIGWVEVPLTKMGMGIEEKSRCGIWREDRKLGVQF